MARLGRRRFVKGSLGTASAAALFSGLFARRASADMYGALVADPAGILDLPEGFTYTVLQRAGAAMDDGYVVPARPDGMACFEGSGGAWILMRNHEVSIGDASSGAYGPGEAPPQAYDPQGFGGVTRLVLDPASSELVSSNLVLTGTARNCAGGPSPWGWLSCEENVQGQHGYVFACPTDASSVVPAQPIVGFGRFKHEAAAVDPDSLVVYLTEDRQRGCLYRHVPDALETPFVGRLQALRVTVAETLDTAPLGTVGEVLEIGWIDVDDPAPPDDSVRSAAQATGAAIFSRGEGLWWFDGQLYIACTNGGPAGLGQIFRLVDDGQSGTLELVAVSQGREHLDFPDNITVAPWGELFVCEDGEAEQLVRTVAPDGSVGAFARNALSLSELTGVCFSPDGSTMFVNLQDDGLTLMVTGPFPAVDVPADDPTGGQSAGAPGCSVDTEAKPDLLTIAASTAALARRAADD